MSADPQHPAWIKPSVPNGYNVDNAVRLHNSLTGNNDVFIPNDVHRITWYACGPTVYDSAHLGHARAYVTFDIIRRVLESCFGFDVTYVMNITDIDDKIIMRARQQFLVERYLSQIKDKTDKRDIVVSFASKAFEARIMSLTKECEELEASMKKNESRRHQKQIEEQIGGVKLKLQRSKDDFTQLMKHVDERVSFKDVFAVARDVIADALDQEQGSSVTDRSIFKQHAERFEAEFLQDMKALHVIDADVLTRVTEYVDPIIAYVQGIIARGFGYEVDGSVYFDTQAFDQSGHDYAKLNPAAKGNLALVSEGEGALADTQASKKSPNDFALWKKSKPGEPFWESPWGQGRPGWHIECSAMASDVLGQNFDIHSGGMDLKFPHHDNELAQSEAFYDNKQWVNYFLHAGFLNIRGLKMSKSLKNFITIRQALDMYSANQLRILFLLQPWDKTMMFADQSLQEAIAVDKRLRDFFSNVAVFQRKGFSAVQKWNEEDRTVHTQFCEAQSRVRLHLQNNIDCPAVMTEIASIMTLANSYMQRTDVKIPLLQKMAAFVSHMMTVFGVSVDADTAADTSQLEPVLDAVAELRKEIRQTALSNKHGDYMKIMDRFRDEVFPQCGVKFEDFKEETQWKLYDPAVLQAEMEEQRRAEQEKQDAKLRTTLARRVKDLETLEKAMVNPSDLFVAMKDKYSQFDENGVPTHDADGVELSKGARKKVLDLCKKQRKAHDKALLNMSKNPHLLLNLRAQVEALRLQIGS